MTTDRRSFLKRSGAALTVAATGCVPDARDAEMGAQLGAPRDLDPALLRGVASVVLPSELGAPGIEAAVQSFEQWAREYEPVAELNHGYGTSEIRYGPPDPIPAWQAQLAALDLEANKRTGDGFLSLDADAQRELLQRQGLDGGSGLPSPLRADHVAIALMAHWFASPDATDRCYGRRITPRACRGIESAPAEPEAI